MIDVGPLLNGVFCGAYINAMVYTLEIMQLTSYIKHFWRRDKLSIKILVVLCFLIDTVCTIAVCAWSMLSTVIHWGDLEYLAIQWWPCSVFVVSTTAVATLVQSFLIYRYFILSSQHIITFILGIFTLAAFTGGISLTSVLITFSTYEDRAKLVMTSILWLGSTAAADLLIMVSLVFTLVRTVSGAPIRSTKAIIHRLILVVIQSGTITTVLALLTLSVFVAFPQTNNSGYFSLSIGRVYTLTMLFTLNLRRDMWNRCQACERNTLGGTMSTAAAHQSEVNKSLRVGLSQVEHHGLGSIQLPPSSQLGLDKKEAASTVNSEGLRGCHASDSLGAV